MSPLTHAELHPIDHKKGSALFSLPSIFRGRRRRSSSNASSSGTHSPSATSRDVSPAPSIGSSSQRRGGEEGGSPSSTRQALPKIILLVDGCSPPPLSPISRTRALPIAGPGGSHHHSPAHAHSPLDPAHSHSHSLESALSHSHLGQSTTTSSDPTTPIKLSPTQTPPSPREGSPPPHADAPILSSLPNPPTILSASPDEMDPFTAPPIGSSITDPLRPKVARHATPAVVHPSSASTRRGGKIRVGAGGEGEKKEERKSTIEMKVGGWVQVEQDY